MVVVVVLAVGFFFFFFSFSLGRDPQVGNFNGDRAGCGEEVTPTIKKQGDGGEIENWHLSSVEPYPASHGIYPFAGKSARDPRSRAIFGLGIGLGVHD